MAKKKGKKILLLGEGPLFPGPKYQVKHGVLNIGELQKQVKRLAIELGPDHSQVRMMKKEIDDRKNREAAVQATRKVNG